MIESVSQLIAVVVGFSVATFISFAILEHLRLMLFEKCGVNRFVGKIDNMIKR